MRNINFKILNPLILLLTITIHLIFISIPPVNYEELFVHASKYLEENNKSQLNFYFKYQANSLFFSYVIYFLNFGIDGIYIGKLISCVGYIFLFFGIKNFLTEVEYSDKKKFFVLCFIFFNPLIWSLGFRSTPDFISFAIGFYGTSLITTGFSKNFFKYSIGSIFVGLSISIKIHSIFFLLFLFFYFFFKKKIFEKKELINFLILTIFIFIIPILFYYFNYKKFGFLLVNNYFKTAHNFAIIDFPEIFLNYLGFISLIFFPFSFFAFLKFFKKLTFIITLFVIFTIGYNFLTIHGEMDIGFLNYFLNKKILAGIYSVFSFVLLISIFLLNKKNQQQFLFTIFAVLSFVILLSLSRPANRYLLYVVPFFFIFIFSKQDMSEKLYFYCKNFYFFLFLILNILILNNHYATGHGINDLLNHIKQNNLNKYYINYGDTFPHRPLFVKKYGWSQKELKSSKPNYLVTKNIKKNDNIVYSSCRNILNLRKNCYYLIKLE